MLSFPPFCRSTKTKKQYDANFVDSGSVMQVLRQQTAEELSSAPIDVEANILAKLDHYAYQEAMLSDADRILHQYLLPMAYPWSEDHVYSDVVKSFPRDIDEMPDILGMEDYSHEPFENGPFGYGKFEVGKSMKGLSSAEYQYGKRAAARRTEDPGVIELTILQDSEDTVEIPANNGHRNIDGNHNHHGETSPRRSSRNCKSVKLDCYERNESKRHFLSDYFNHFRESKKVKTDYAAGNVQKRHVSVRFGSVSSRSSIFESDVQPWRGSHLARRTSETDSYTKTAPILVKVQLPLEVQTGRTLVIPVAEENSKVLGSYDMRYGMPNLDSSQKSVNRTKRIATGRTRLMWTKAHRGGTNSNELTSGKQRLAFSSILTSDRIDISLFRRPRDVTLSIRVNGARLTQKRNDTASLKSVPDQAVGDDDVAVAAASGLSLTTVSDAIMAACGPVSPGKSKKKHVTTVASSQFRNSENCRDEPFCFLKGEMLLRSLLQEGKAETAATKYSTKMDAVPKAIDSEMVGSPMWKYTGPVLNCLPTADGLVRVVCTVAGNMMPCWVPAILELDANETKSTRCSVCFVADATEPVKSCTSCGVMVHLSCCYGKGTLSAGGSSWSCSLCSTSTWDDSSPLYSSNTRKRKSKTPFRFRDAEQAESAALNPIKQNTSSLQCQLCPHSGGAMSPSSESAGYVHEVCRIWTRLQPQSPCAQLGEIKKNPLLTRLRTLCSLCGNRVTDAESNELIRCVASGCQVRFHPMCGLLASKIATSEATEEEMPANKLERMNILDSQLCKQYTLTMMKCTVDSKASCETKVLPVAFCGFHNPIRDTSLYGCYPCGGMVGDAMRIPSLNSS